MVQFSNTRTSHTVKNVSNTLSLQGDITIDANQRIVQFNGSISIEDNYVGNFYYNEQENGKYSKNFSDSDLANSTQIENFLDATIEEIKTQLQ